jgi:CheY-like chemotaxis protein
MNGDNVTKRLQNLETRYAELMVRLSGLADMQEIEHQRLLRLEQTVNALTKPKTLAERLGRLWPTT